MPYSIFAKPESVELEQLLNKIKQEHVESSEETLPNIYEAERPLNNFEEEITSDNFEFPDPELEEIADLLDDLKQEDTDNLDEGQVSSSLNSFACDQCSAKFSKESNVSMHIQLCHEDNADQDPHHNQENSSTSDSVQNIPDVKLENYYNSTENAPVAEQEIFFNGDIFDD